MGTESTDEAVALLGVLDVAIPNYISVFTGFMAGLEGLCDNKQADSCGAKQKWLKQENADIDAAVAWLENAKKKILARYESWMPKACTKWLYTAYDTKEFVHGKNSNWNYGNYMYASHRKCESYKFYAQPHLNSQRKDWWGNVIADQYIWKNKRVGVGYVLFGKYAKRVGVSYSMMGRRLSAWQKLWYRSHAVSDSEFGIAFARKTVAAEIALYKQELKKWSAFFDAKYIEPLKAFKNGMNSGIDGKTESAPVSAFASIDAFVDPFENFAGGDNDDGVQFVDGARLAENSLPYWMFAVACVPFILCCFVNAVCAYKHCRNEKGVYAKVDLIVEDEDVNEV